MVGPARRMCGGGGEYSWGCVMMAVAGALIRGDNLGSRESLQR